MKVLISPTDEYIRLAKTQLSADVAAGSSVALSVYGNEGMAQNNYVVVGIEGTDTCEICQINASVTAGTTIQVATLIFAHKQDEPVRIFRYNQRKFYGATTSTGSYTNLTSSGSPKTIQVNEPQGTMLEYTGNEGYTYFKSTYWNSTTSEETDINDSVAVLANESLRYCSLEVIRRQAGMMDNPFMTDGMLETYRTRAENEVNSSLISKYSLPLTRASDNIQEVPAILENATMLLAAGYMDYREYGKDGEGVKWLGEARGILKSIQEGRQHLIGTDMLEMNVVTDTVSISGYPDDTASPAIFGVRDRY